MDKKWRIILGPILYLATGLYGLIVRLRLLLFRLGILKTKRLRNRVISIGNLTAGGSGKTPLVELTAQLLQQEGENVIVLSRGYKAVKNADSTLVSDGTQILTDWEHAGDEPFLLAANLPTTKVAIGKDRFALGKQLEGEHGNCTFILDDGYQHLRLARDLNVLLIDATDPFGGERLLPVGRLREPLQGIKRADLVVITRSDHPFDEKLITNKIRRYNKDVHVVYAYHDVVGLVPLNGKDPVDIREFSSRRVIAMAGVAKPEIFIKDLEHFQVAILKKFLFPDHHKYSQTDINSVIAAARELKANAVITTQKDAVKLSNFNKTEIPFYYLKIQAKVDDLGRFKLYLESALGNYGP